MKGNVRWGVLVACVLAISAAAFVYVSIRSWSKASGTPDGRGIAAGQGTAQAPATRASGGSTQSEDESDTRGTYTPQLGISDDANAAAAYIYEHTWPLKKLSDDDVEVLISTFEDYEEVYVRRWAAAIMADRYARAQMSDRAKGLIEATLFSALSDENWRIRRNAIAASEDAGLIGLTQFRRRIIAMRSDENEAVAARATASVEVHHLDGGG